MEMTPLSNIKDNIYETSLFKTSYWLTCSQMLRNLQIDFVYDQENIELSLFVCVHVYDMCFVCYMDLIFLV